jgi:DNA invertase Pin-like site-specific DNA recombinase
MNAVIYIRVSTKEQTSNLSLPTQRKSCVEYCQKHGYSVDDIFTEQGESAKTAERPEFSRLLSYCHQKKGTIQAVVVYSLSRFARNSHDFYAVKGLLAGLGITLRSVTEATDDTSTGKLMEGILAAFA